MEICIMCTVQVINKNIPGWAGTYCPKHVRKKSESMIKKEVIATSEIFYELILRLHFVHFQAWVQDLTAVEHCTYNDDVCIALMYSFYLVHCVVLIP